MKDSLEELIEAALTEEEKKPKGFAAVKKSDPIPPNDVIDFLDEYQVSAHDEGTPQRILYHFYEQWHVDSNGPKATRPLFYKILNSKFQKKIKNRITYNLCASPDIKLDLTEQEQILIQQDAKQGNLWRKKRRYSRDAKEYSLYLKLKAKYERNETD